MFNLRTGTMTPHSPQQYFTYTLATPYDPCADQSLWLRFLRQVVGGGPEVLEYLQTAVGYSITGHTNEEKLHYLFGPTRAGKGVFSETLLTLLDKPLCHEVDFNTLTRDRNNDANNFDLAPLKPARLLFAAESSRSQRLNDAKIKLLTGGNNVRCAFKYGDHFEYRPQFKIWLASNYDVELDPHDIAAWGRIVRIHFPHSFLGQEDITLKERLKAPANLQGVLAWAVEGAQCWYQEGLPTLSNLEQELQGVRQELDTVQQWLEVYCELDGSAFTTNKALYTHYRQWCALSGTELLAPIQLGRVLAQHPSLRSDRQKHERGIAGLRLRG